MSDKPDDTPNGTDDVLRVKRIEIVDEQGKVRATLGANKEGEGYGLRFLSEEGRLRQGLGIAQDTSVVEFDGRWQG